VLGSCHGGGELSAGRRSGRRGARGKGPAGRARAAAGVQVTRGGGWKQEVVRQQRHSGGRGGVLRWRQRRQRRKKNTGER
jgi:hypothetical protein